MIKRIIHKNWWRMWKWLVWFFRSKRELPSHLLLSLSQLICLSLSVAKRWWEINSASVIVAQIDWLSRYLKMFSAIDDVSFGWFIEEKKTLCCVQPMYRYYLCACMLTLAHSKTFTFAEKRTSINIYCVYLIRNSLNGYALRPMTPPKLHLLCYLLCAALHVIYKIDCKLRRPSAQLIN